MDATEAQQLAERYVPLALRVVRTIVPRLSRSTLNRAGGIGELQSIALLALTIAAKRYTPKPGATFGTYAFHWIRGAVWRHIEQQTKHTATELPDVPGPEADLDQAERRAAVKKAVARLPAKEREIVEARYVEGLSLRAIAERRGVTGECVRQAELRARTKLAEMLQPFAEP